MNCDDGSGIVWLIRQITTKKTALPLTLARVVRLTKRTHNTQTEQDRRQLTVRRANGTTFSIDERWIAAFLLVLLFSSRSTLLSFAPGELGVKIR